MYGADSDCVSGGNAGQDCDSDGNSDDSRGDDDDDDDDVAGCADEEMGQMFK